MTMPEGPNQDNELSLEALNSRLSDVEAQIFYLKTKERHRRHNVLAIAVASLFIGFAAIKITYSQSSEKGRELVVSSRDATELLLAGASALLLVTKGFGGLETLKKLLEASKK